MKSITLDRRNDDDMVAIVTKLRKEHPNWSIKQIMNEAKSQWQKQWNERNKK